MHTANSVHAMEPQDHNPDEADYINNGPNLATARPFRASDFFDRSEGSSDNEDEKPLPERGEETENFDAAEALSQHTYPHTVLPSSVESSGVKRKHSEQIATGLALPTKRLAKLPEVTKDEHAASAATPSTPWDLAADRSFCSALFEIGLSEASPSVLLESMDHRNEACITSERIKSHLQKYRKNKQKALGEFWAQYDAFLSIRSLSDTAPADLSSLATAVAQAGNLHRGPLRGGHFAAFLTTVVHMADDAPTPPAQQQNPPIYPWSIVDSWRDVVLPDLTAREQTSHLGQSITQTFGLFHSVCHHILEQRIIVDDEDINISDMCHLVDDATGLDDETE